MHIQTTAKLSESFWGKSTTIIMSYYEYMFISTCTGTSSGVSPHRRMHLYFILRCNYDIHCKSLLFHPILVQKLTSQTSAIFYHAEYSYMTFQPIGPLLGRSMIFPLAYLLTFLSPSQQNSGLIKHSQSTFFDTYVIMNY